MEVLNFQVPPPVALKRFSNKEHWKFQLESCESQKHKPLNFTSHTKFLFRSFQNSFEFQLCIWESFCWAFFTIYFPSLVRIAMWSGRNLNSDLLVVSLFYDKTFMQNYEQMWIRWMWKFLFAQLSPYCVFVSSLHFANF